MTEDRHTFSAPRPKSSSAPSSSEPYSNPSSSCFSWDVDIYRNGVPDPIDTIEISEDTLPSRTNKKGKVLWRLPAKPDILPSFGTVERRRIMDLVKERKKNRRKKSGGGIVATDIGAGDGVPAVSKVDIAPVSKVEIAPDISKNGERSSLTPQRMKQEKDDNGGLGPGVAAVVLGGKSNGSRVRADLPSSGENVGNLRTKKISTSDIKVSVVRVKKTSASAYLSKRKKKKDTSTFVPSVADDYVPDVRSHFNRKEEDKLEMCMADEKVVTKELGPPPGLPPGFEQSLSSLSMETVITPTDNMGHYIALSNSIRNPISTAVRTIDSQTMPNNSIPLEQPSPKPHLPLNPPPPPSRHIIIPEHGRPAKTSINHHPSLAVAAATAFIDLYYPHISHGQTSDLALHYTAHAQKSISVGGAHSVVADRSDITLQLSSLSSSVFFVRGVVAQDSHDGSGVHILVTGVVQTTALPSSSGVSPFAHSISLVPAAVERRQMENGGGMGVVDDIMPYAFQIHNDALSLLTVVEMMAPVAVSPWHDSMTGQHQQPQHQQPQHQQPLHHQPRRQPQHQPQHQHPIQDVPHRDVHQGLSNPSFSGKQPPPGLF